MANVKLGTKAVGDIVKLKVNGAYKEFIVVNHGKPDSTYDDSCNGTWLLMKECYEYREWNSSEENRYAKSTIHSYLNSTFLHLFESSVQNAIKSVKIPYSIGNGVYDGSNGLDTKIFLLSSSESNASMYYNTSTIEGAKLSYFNNRSSDAILIAYLVRTAVTWCLRTPRKNSDTMICVISEEGSGQTNSATYSYGIRPALILPTTLLVADDGAVLVNTPPTITSASGASGVNLGTKAAAFSFQYTVADADGDALTVVEKLDGVVMKTRSNVASGSTLTFEYPSTAADFQKILNGSHTLTVEVNDGNDTAVFTAAFTKAVYEASITMQQPLAVEGDITLAITSLLGEIPDDADLTVEVTNNAKDSTPVWQDVTEEVLKGKNIGFTNKIAANGAAFNFRIVVKRGASGTGGYISNVTGAFQ